MPTDTITAAQWYTTTMTGGPDHNAEATTIPNPIRHRGEQSPAEPEPNLFDGDLAAVEARVEAARQSIREARERDAIRRAALDGLRRRPPPTRDNPSKIKHNGGGPQYNRLRFTSSLENKG